MRKASFKTFLAASAICMIAMTSCCGSISGNGETSGTPKYIFLFIGDGMGAGHAAVAESYLSYKEGKLGGEQLCFSEFPVLGTCTTYSADHQITCSSAAGTAISCGAKTNNGYLGVDPQGNELKSIAYELKDNGYKIGIMSSVPVNHATPAAFYGHNTDREDYYSISMEIPESGFDFFGGSGFLQFNGKDGKSRPTPEVLEENGYTVCFGETAFRAEMDSTDHIVFIQPSGKDAEAGNYEVDDDKENDSRLAQMLQMGLDFITDKEPFFIMCEGGEIDWAAHANMTMPMVDAVLRFNEAVQTAYEFYLAHKEETLILVTADHETGGITLGCNGSLSIDWKVLDEAWEEGGEPSSQEENRKLNGYGIGWTSSNHTGAPVPIYAIGCGAERFAGRMDNTEIMGRILGKVSTIHE